MIVGLMAIWAGMGTFSFGDYHDSNGGVTQPGIFSQVRPAANAIALHVPDGMVAMAAQAECASVKEGGGIVGWTNYSTNPPGRRGEFRWTRATTAAQYYRR